MGLELTVVSLWKFILISVFRHVYIFRQIYPLWVYFKKYSLYNILPKIHLSLFIFEVPWKAWSPWTIYSQTITTWELQSHAESFGLWKFFSRIIELWCLDPNFYVNVSAKRIKVVPGSSLTPNRDPPVIPMLEYYWVAVPIWWKMEGYPATWLLFLEPLPVLFDILDFTIQDLRDAKCIKSNTTNIRIPTTQLFQYSCSPTCPSPVSHPGPWQRK